MVEEGLESRHIEGAGRKAGRIMLEEHEYITVENRVLVSQALVCLRGVLPGPRYGIDLELLATITKPLSEAQDKLFAAIRDMR